MSRKFVLGDIHGAYRALIQCFQKSEFDYRNDLLISIGDACDGWPETREVVDELLKIENLIYILGNHDYWALEWFVSGNSPYIWIRQGGDATMDSYKEGVPDSHILFFQNAKYYYILNNTLFVHGGIDINRKLEEQENDTFIWDRELVSRAALTEQYGEEQKLTTFDEIYVGHTPTINYGSSVPVKACEVWMIDTGAGWSGGKLSMMNIETKEYFQSDDVDMLYPGVNGRG